MIISSTRTLLSVRPSIASLTRVGIRANDITHARIPETPIRSMTIAVVLAASRMTAGRPPTVSVRVVKPATSAYTTAITADSVAVK
jgi:hypothetical protein